MRTKNLVRAALSVLTAVLANTSHAYMGGFEAQDGYKPFFNDVKGYNAGQYGTNNGGPGGSSVVIPINTGLWSRIDPVAPGFSYATGHQYRDRTYVNTSGASGLISDLGLVLTTNHQGWTAQPLHYRYNLDNRDFNGAAVSSSANSVVKVSFWWCAQMDQNVGNGYFGDEISFFDSANKLGFRLGLTERNTGDKVTFWNGTTMFESAITAAAGRYDRWDLTFNYVTKTVSAKYFQFATSTLYTLATNVPLVDVTANGLDHMEFKTTPGVTNDKLMSVDDFSMEVIKDPEACMKITNGSIGCVPKSTGGYTYTYNFTLTNLTGQFIQNALVPAVATVPNNGSVTLSPQVIPVNLANGASTNVSVTINGATPGQMVCFRVALFNPQFTECCSEVVCLEMPCVKFTQEAITCAPGVVGVVNYSPTIVNVSGGPVKWIEFIPKTPGVQINPGQIDLGSLANNASASVGPLQITGALPNSQVCFYVVLIDAQLRKCCIEEHCIQIPNCGISPVALTPLPTGTPAKPCPSNAAGGIPSPDGCLVICDEKIICDTSDPASGIPCALYTFTVTNQSTFPISNLVFPSAAVTPPQIFFNPPLAPGQASTVTVKICGQPPGSFQFPIVALGLDQRKCCSMIRDLVLPPCACLQVLQSSIKCFGVDANGTFCYSWNATIQNLEPWLANHSFLLPAIPTNVSFTPQYFNIPPLAQFGTANLSSIIKAPGNPSSITISITIHDTDFTHCCAIPVTIQLPKCCICDITLNFPQDPAGGSAGGLPAGVSLLNLIQDPTGKIGFPATPQPFPYVYMAASGRGTIVKIDDTTGAVLGEYRTVPQSRGGFHNPSRTTVDRFGECWVGNRNDVYTVGTLTTGSVMRIGLIIGGTRGNKAPKVGGGWTVTPSPTGQYLEGPFTYTSPSVTDRDGDGLIHTSSGLGDILAWDSALAGGNNSGGVSLADDEVIVTFTRTRALGVRALAIDANNDLWVGGYPSQNVYGRISGTTGVADWSTGGPNPGIRNIGGGYGALIDANNVLWSVSREGSSSTYGVYRHNISANSTTFVSAEGNYGIGIDLCTNSIWVSSVFPSNETRSGFNLINKYVLRHFDSAGTLLGAYAQPRPAQGLSVDSNGHPFVSGVYYSPGEVWHYSPTGTLLATITGTNLGSTGTAVDHNGKIWVSDFTGNQALRVNPVTNTQEIAVPLNPGATPYNYSDMTGYVSLNAAGQFGMLQYMHDSKCPDTDWGRVSWTTLGEVQKTCSISVEVRASNNPLNFPSLWTPVKNLQNFCGRGIKGQYIQVRVIFRRPAGCPPQCNPRLCSLRIECCDDISHGNGGVVGVSPVLSAPQIVHVVAGNPTSIRVFASDADGDAMTATLTREGYSASGVVTDGSVVFSVPLNQALVQAGAGKEEFTISVSDGVNVTTQDVTVIYGDLPPTISAPSPRSVKAFSAFLPDFRPEAVVYDDITPVANLIVTQSPPPGTLVSQGITNVRLFVADQAGQTGQTETYFEVAAVVSVGGVVNYQAVAAGGSFSPVPVLDGVPPGQIASTQLLVDGAVYRTSPGLMTASPVQLPAGDHLIVFRVWSASDQSSQSRPLVIYVVPDPGGATSGPLPILAIHTGPQGCDLTCTLAAGKTWNLMRSTDLINWELEQTLIGTGEPITIPIASIPGVTRLFFRLQDK